MSAANEDTDRDAIASCCSHGGEEPMAIADRSHEPACACCCGVGSYLIHDQSNEMRVECEECKGSGRKKHR